MGHCPFVRLDTLSLNGPAVGFKHAPDLHNQDIFGKSVKDSPNMSKARITGYNASHSESRLSHLTRTNR